MGEKYEDQPTPVSVKLEEWHIEFGMHEAIGILSSLSLTSVTLGDFLVVNRAEFDVIISLAYNFFLI